MANMQRIIDIETNLPEQPNPMPIPRPTPQPRDPTPMSSKQETKND